MPLHVALTHKTTYTFDRAVSLGPHVVRLRPAPHCRTPILAYSLSLDPARHFINWQQDPFGNFLARVVVPEKTPSFSVSVDLVADMATINPFDFFVEDAAVNYPFAYDATLAGELEPYLKPLPLGPAFEAYLGTFDLTPRQTIGLVLDINRKLSRDIDYRVRMEPGVQAPEETLAIRSGSCRDSGWLLVQILRRIGLATRFVSGYLIQLRPDQVTADGPTTEDFCDLHAWAEVYIPGAGWIGLDATSGLLAGEGHIPLAATPSPISAAPVTGTHEPAQVDFSFAMQVTRIVETPRVSRPYGEAAWHAILAAGDAVDERLRAGDVRLSMGGEPTFVAADDVQAPEWTIAALGPTKRAFADNLARRLQLRFGSGGLLHYGQGKWYPGESAARWSFGVHWRKDGVPLWQDASLIGAEVPERAAGIEDASTFARALCSRLGLEASAAIPAYEDAAHFALIEQKLPSGVTPAENRLADPAERERLIRAFAQGLDAPTGYVLPLVLTTGSGADRRWSTERWSFRRGHLFLIPGDSPIGLRLPLSGLQEIAYLDFPDVTPTDPFAPRADLPSAGPCTAEAPATATAAEISGPVRTALAIEPRGGQLCVFLPPLRNADDYVALLAAIEAAAAATGQRVQLEGYAPPFDPRVDVIKVTPDPGVIEVNVHPAGSWRQAVAITTGVYEDAEAVGLMAGKFTLDGRHVATGGGNHIVLGGITPADSPFLRRPDLLGSVLAYWQNHPALSYLFSGLFIGPTSQAPRVDEGRHESLYELEIALAQLPEPGGQIAPWLVDRLFRNLLVDVTGNTHRAEVCIDKLYAPEGPMGRLGLVEFRAFEMPPHARMSLAQQLLIRALVAWFWERPYRQPLVRWGPALHDRFMLPHYLWADLESVVGDLQRAGLPMQTAWFRPHLEFRCPQIGGVEHGGVALEVRQALEPWLVLGEESASGATARTVDASLERLQVKVGGVAGDRYRVACNGYVLPLTPTGLGGEAVAGVRFRAWNQTTGFHPTIPAHVPLTFDIVDTWTGRSLGGCRYHASHPGGRNFQTPPINALEAEARRNARFESTGHSHGSAEFQTLPVHPDSPLTLDLRRAASTSRTG
jgi:uncharacterized protein (DUF2126 family)/transglutaminase-like putative cysteine protease